MQLSKFVAVLSWINSFILAWVMVLQFPTDKVLAVFALLLFVSAALISSNVQAQKTQERD